MPHGNCYYIQREVLNQRGHTKREKKLAYFLTISAFHSSTDKSSDLKSSCQSLFYFMVLLIYYYYYLYIMRSATGFHIQYMYKVIIRCTDPRNFFHCIYVVQ